MLKLPAELTSLLLCIATRLNTLSFVGSTLISFHGHKHSGMCM